MNYTLVRGGVELNLVQVLVSYCKNATLQAFYPNLTCKTREETNAVVPFTSFLSATLEQFLTLVISKNRLNIFSNLTRALLL